jgi:hypothetical protein
MLNLTTHEDDMLNLTTHEDGMLNLRSRLSQPGTELRFLRRPVRNLVAIPTELSRQLFSLNHVLK